MIGVDLVYSNYYYLCYVRYLTGVIRVNTGSNNNYTTTVAKLTEKVSFKRTESQEEIQTAYMDKVHAILTLYGSIFFDSLIKKFNFVKI